MIHLALYGGKTMPKTSHTWEWYVYTTFKFMMTGGWFIVLSTLYGSYGFPHSCGLMIVKQYDPKKQWYREHQHLL